MRTPKLIPLKMSLAREHNHPGINGRSTYLCRIGGRYFVGKFSKQWYGWNFDGWTPNPVGLQFDAPGSNSSEWEQIWRLK